MAESATLTFSWGQGAETLQGVYSPSSDNGIEADIDLINGTVTADVQILTAGLKGIFMLSDKAVTVIAKKADASTIQTFVLVANKPYGWTSDMPPGPTPNPFSDNIATLVCTASAVGVLKVRIIQDATP